jgi:hypothetical protein
MGNFFNALLAASTAVGDVRLTKAVKPTLRMGNTSSKNLSGIGPVHSLLFVPLPGRGRLDSG